MPSCEPTQVLIHNVSGKWGLDMVREGTFDSESVRPDKQKSADVTTEGDNLIPVSSSGSDTSDGKFDDLMKAEFIKLVCGGWCGNAQP